MNAPQLLTWQNDPVFFDLEPVPKNQWLNANDLIRAGRKKEIFTGGEGNTLNLLPILVRRMDFVRKKSSDRILARFPFVKMTLEEKESIKENILLVAEKVRNYLYKSDNRSILNWRDTLANCLEREFLPLPIIRCCEDFIRIDLSTVRNFASARGEAFTMPVKLTEELAYLAGMINGDGNLQRYTLSIIDYSLQNIQQLKDKFSRIFAQEGRIQFKTPNSPELIITNKWAVRFFSFLTSQPIDARKYDALQEPLLFQKEPLRSSYWGGVMDADGSYVNSYVTFTSASKRFASDFLEFLRSNEIYAKFRERGDGTFQVYLPRKFHRKYKALIKCFHPEKAGDYLKLDEVRVRGGKFFVGFKEEAMVEGYFDFRLLRGLQIIGLTKYIKQSRDGLKVKDFAANLDIHPSVVSNLENKVNAIPLELLEKILQYENKPLMPFLSSFGKELRFRMRRSPPVHLDAQPNESLEKIAHQLIFHKNLIRLSSTLDSLKEMVERHFGIIPENSIITTKVLRDFFGTFCKFSSQKI